jgi:hypothetical protein
MMMLGGCRIIQKIEVIEGNSVQLEIVTRNVLDLQDRPVLTECGSERKR